MHTYTHVYAHIFAHTHTHPYIYTHTHAYTLKPHTTRMHKSYKIYRLQLLVELRVDCN